MQVLAELEDVELAEVEAAVGERSFSNGIAYARGSRVVAAEWEPGGCTLGGTVVGHGAIYSTVAYFERDEDDELTFSEGECSCPVGYNCKHVAAIVIAASQRSPRIAASQRSPRVAASQRSAQGPRLPGRLSPPRRRQPEPAPWEDSLRALLPTPISPAADTPLAIELALHVPGASALGDPRLMARLMRPGARGGWVNGSLSWNRLDAWELRTGSYRDDHLALVRELFAVHRAADGRPSYHYAYGAEKKLDLTGCESPQLWAVLDEAVRQGLALVHAKPGLGEVSLRRDGEIALDVTTLANGDSFARPTLRLGADPAHHLLPVTFIGTRGHGVVCVERAGSEGSPDLTDLPLVLVRLARPAPPPLQRMLLDRQELRIPSGELGRFAEQLSPALRHVAPVISSDGSFTPPEVLGPALALGVTHAPGHSVEAGWAWAYRVGETIHRVPLSPAGAGESGLRDLEAEQAALAELTPIEPDIEHFGLLDDRGRPARGPVALTGIDSMRFTTEALPRLRERWPAVTVELTGEAPEYRDVSGSLSIGLSTHEAAGERDWFDLGVTITVEGRELPFAEVFVALAEGASHVLLDDGAHFTLLDPRLQELRRLIEEARALQDSPAAPLRISRWQAGLWSELVALGVVREQAEAWQRQVEALLELDRLAEHEAPAALDAHLRPYQRDGFAWLATLWELELGGILADDMGLGKTLQALGLICHAREADPDLGPFLVVAPTSVVTGWVGEAARFAPGLRLEAVTDTLGRGGRTIEQLAAADVVVTTYTLFRLDADSYGAISWAGLILDEAQYVKNHQSKTHRCARRLDARFKLAITGTPMENNLMELWSLLSIVAPGLFPDPKRFAEHYARPIERDGDAERLARLRRRIKPLMKRRTKELVAAELPAKQEQTLEIDLHPRHRRAYDTHLQRERQKVLGLIGDFDRNRFTILRSITLLRQLSLHAELVDERYAGVPCAKLGALVEQLQDVVGGGHRALVFSQFTGFLARVRERLEEEGIGYCYLDGRTRRREQVIRRFKDGADPVFLISLKAGGFGLNLTEADYCFLLDPWWNPATETQAIDRAHRIGQTRPVMVYRMIARDTIEEKVVALARRKAALFSGVMDEGDLFASKLTAEDIRTLVA